MTDSEKKSHLFGQIIAAAADSSSRAPKSDPMIDLIVDAFSASPREKKRLEALAKKLLSEQRSLLRRSARAPLCKAELEAEVANLIEAAGVLRRARAAKHRPNAYQPPMATRTEFQGKVDIAGMPKAPSPHGYSPAKDLAKLANLTEEQWRFAQEFIGRPLGPITVWPPGAASPRVVNLADLWLTVAERSPAVQDHMRLARDIMKEFDGKSREVAHLLGEADAARNSGQVAKAKILRERALANATAADQLRKQAKQHGDAAYSNVRNAFWREVHKQPDLVEHFRTNMGLQFLPDGLNSWRGGPFFQTPRGKERLTLEHMLRRNDDPRLAIDLANLIVSPTTENVLMNEAIRHSAPMQWR